MRTRPYSKNLLSAIVILLLITPLRAADKYATLKNSQVQDMLDHIEQDIKDYYFDPSLRGFSIDKVFSEAREKIATAPSQDDALLLLANAVNRMHDSHTVLHPPARPYAVDYGFRMQSVGDTDCFVTSIRPGSDAEAKGLKPGDRVVALNDIPVTRQNLHSIEFGYAVFPQSGFHLKIQAPDETEKALTVLAKVTPGQREISNTDFDNYMEAHRSLEERRQLSGPENLSQFSPVQKKVLFWKLPNFAMIPVQMGDEAKRAKSVETVVLDLRGNPGGRVDSLQELLGRFFPKDVKIGDLKMRDGSKAQSANGRGEDASNAKLIVLIDSKSASAAELFARVVQLEKRGVVLGDRSSGHVMVGRQVIHAVKMDAVNLTQYGASITIADIIMKDGKSLEGAGVTPDERILPTAADMAAHRDPVLVRAAALAGIEMTPEKAGTIFEVKWNDKPFMMD
jgi:C-terminal processing protease CtpA/Prc